MESTVNQVTTEAIADCFSRQAALHPTRLAIDSKDCQWTYADLDVAITTLAGRLNDLTCSVSSNHVGLLFESDAAMVVALMAAIKAGRVYVPLDTAYPGSRLHHMMEDSDVRIILTNNANIDLALNLDSDQLEVINVDSTADIVRRGIRNGERAWRSTDVCILYTSGSTGKPKGTVQSCASTLETVKNYTEATGISSADRCTVLSSHSHVMAMFDVLSTLLNGATLCPFNVKRDGIAELAKYIFDKNVTIYRSSVSLFRTLVRTVCGNELSTLRVLSLGAEPVFASDFELFKAHCSSSCIFLNTYGSTEATMVVMHKLRHSDQIEGAVVPIGRPVGMNEIALIDECGNDTASYGEIEIRSPHLPPGYWRSATCDGTGFRPDPRSNGRWVYRTGDTARRTSDGLLLLVGRNDQQVKIRGQRVELGEVEIALRKHDGIQDSIVLAPAGPDGERHILAYVVPQAGNSLSARQLLSYLRTVVPDYMMPTAVVLTDALPRTAGGKVDRRAAMDGLQRILSASSDADLALLAQSVESTLMEIADVVSAAIATKKDAAGYAFIAYVVCKADFRSFALYLRSYLLNRYPAALVPSTFVFVEELPMRPSGDVNRTDLYPLNGQMVLFANDVARPHTLEEQVIARIWKGLLGLNDIGLDDNFFDLGGHSLMAMQVVALLADSFHVVVPVRAVFESPTIRGLSGVVSKLLKSES